MQPLGVLQETRSDAEYVNQLVHCRLLARILGPRDREPVLLFEKGPLTVCDCLDSNYWSSGLKDVALFEGLMALWSTKFKQTFDAACMPNPAGGAR